MFIATSFIINRFRRNINVYQEVYIWAKVFSQITTTDYCAMTKCHRLRVLLEIGVVGATCLYWPKPGAFGSTKWTQHRSKMPSALPGYLSLTSAGHVWGHGTEKVPELPLLVEDEVEGYKTVRLFCFLRNLRPGMIEKSLCLSMKEGWLEKKKGKESLHPVRGMLHHLLWVQQYRQRVRNTRGTTLLSVSKLNILTLAPGGHLD